MRSIADWPKGMPPPSYTFPWEWRPTNYPAPYLAVPRTEEQVQGAILDYLLHRHILAWPTDSGAKKLRGRAVGALRRAGHAKPELALKGRTGAAHQGHPDIIGCWMHPVHAGRMVAVEVKVPAHVVNGKIKKPAGLPTQAQLAFLDRLYRAGAIVCVAWSVQDVAIALAAVDAQEEAFL